MKRWLYAFGILAAAAAGCRDTGGTVVQDMSRRDGATDMAVPLTDGGGGDMTSFMATTLRDINLGVPHNTPVAVTGVIVTGIAKGDGTTSYNAMTMQGGFCEYIAFVEDPNGNSPKGMKLYKTGQKCQLKDGGTSCDVFSCPLPPMSGTPLDGIALGDKVDITGKVSVFTPKNNDLGGLGDPQHEIVVSSLTRTGTGTITPPVVTDGTQYAKGGMGYIAHENELVTIKPAQPAPTTMANSFGEYTWAGAAMDDSYRFVYNAGSDGGMFPTTGQTFSQITGIARPDFGGSVNPRIKEDFIP